MAVLDTILGLQQQEANRFGRMTDPAAANQTFAQTQMPIISKAFGMAQENRAMSLREKAFELERKQMEERKKLNDLLFKEREVGLQRSRLELQGYEHNLDRAANDEPILLEFGQELGRATPEETAERGQEYLVNYLPRLSPQGQMMARQILNDSLAKKSVQDYQEAQKLAIQIRQRDEEFKLKALQEQDKELGDLKNDIESLGMRVSDFTTPENQIDYAAMREARKEELQKREIEKAKAMREVDSNSGRTNKVTANSMYLSQYRTIADDARREMDIIEAELEANRWLKPEEKAARQQQIKTIQQERDRKLAELNRSVLSSGNMTQSDIDQARSMSEEEVIPYSNPAVRSFIDRAMGMGK